MWLSMLTADAAAQHGHEFSAPKPPRPQNPALRLPFPRSPFDLLPSSRSRTQPAPSSSGQGRRTLLPKRSRSLRVTMAELREEPEEVDELDELDEEQFSKMRIPGAFNVSLTTLRSQSPEIKTTTEQPLIPLVPTEPPGPPLHPSVLVEPTILPDMTESITPSCVRRTHRSKIQYRLAHPPPIAKTKQKVLLPRLVLQLQQQTQSGRHKPSFEIVPACRFPGDTRIGQKLSKLHQLASRDGKLASEDLVIVGIDDNKPSDLTNDEPGLGEDRTDVAIICATPSVDGKTPGDAFIHLEQSIWKAHAAKDGMYEFTMEGDEEQQARWYVPKSKRRRPRSINGPADLAAVDDRKLYFATIQPGTTKHPTIASMTYTNLDVYDSYIPTNHLNDSVEGAASSSSPSHDGKSPLAEDAVPSADAVPSPVPVDDALKKLVIASAAWVFFREGWSPFFHYTAMQPASHYATSANPPRISQRSASMPVVNQSSTPTLGVSRRESVLAGLTSVPRLVRSATSRSKTPKPTATPSVLSSIPDTATSDSEGQRTGSFRRKLSIFTPSISTRSSNNTTAPPSERSPSPFSHPVTLRKGSVTPTGPSPLHSSPASKQQVPRPVTPPQQTGQSTPSTATGGGSASAPATPTPTPYWQQFDQLVRRRMTTRTRPQSEPQNVIPAPPLHVNTLATGPQEAEQANTSLLYTQQAWPDHEHAEVPRTPTRPNAFLHPRTYFAYRKFARRERKERAAERREAERRVRAAMNEEPAATQQPAQGRLSAQWNGMRDRLALKIASKRSRMQVEMAAR